MPHCRLTPTVIQLSGRELTVCGVMRLSAELEAPPEGWGRCGEIQGLSRPFGDIGNMGYHADTCREICCSPAHVSSSTRES